MQKYSSLVLVVCVCVRVCQCCMLLGPSIIFVSGPSINFVFSSGGGKGVNCTWHLYVCCITIYNLLQSWFSIVKCSEVIDKVKYLCTYRNIHTQ